MRRFLASGVAFALLVTVSFSAGTARADTAPAPRPRRIGLIVGGATTFAVGYGLGVLAAFARTGSTNQMCPCSGGSNATQYLLIPLAGPWIALGAAHGSDSGIFALLGIVQATGAALTAGGIVRYISDGTPAEGSGEAPGALHARSRPSTFVSFGVLPARDGAFGFLSGRL